MTTSFKQFSLLCNTLFLIYTNINQGGTGTSYLKFQQVAEETIHIILVDAFKTNI